MINELDLLGFHYINQLALPSWLDFVVILSRYAWVWLPLYFIAVVIFFRVWPKRLAIRNLIVLLLCIGFIDFTNSSLLKPSINRSRPCQVLESNQLILRVNCGVGKSFPSSHAANHMGLACYLILLMNPVYRRRWGWLLILWALAIGFAQIYVGVHYPTDIFAGFGYGFMIALSFYRLLNKPKGNLNKIGGMTNY